MAIPKFDAIRIQALKLLGNGQTLKPKDFFQPLAEQFRLDENDKNAMYPSGNGYIFYDRISWALSYLYLAQLVDKPQRGLYRINPQGLKMLSEHTPEEINDYVEQTVQARTPRKSRRAGTTTEALALSDTPSGELTPQEALEQSFDNIRKSVYAEILETIIGKSPRAFERLVVQLLQAMGYGGEVKGSGQVTRASKDGGIDGIIKEDILGFGRIYIQAKRYGLNYAVQRDEVQKFVGALAVAQSHKGVFHHDLLFYQRGDRLREGTERSGDDRADRRQATGRIHLRFQTGHAIGQDDSHQKAGQRLLGRDGRRRQKNDRIIPLSLLPCAAPLRDAPAFID